MHTSHTPCYPTMTQFTFRTAQSFMSYLSCELGPLDSHHIVVLAGKSIQAGKNCLCVSWYQAVIHTSEAIGEASVDLFRSPGGIRRNFDGASSHLLFS